MDIASFFRTNKRVIISISALLLIAGLGLVLYVNYFRGSALPDASADQVPDKPLAPVLTADELRQKMLNNDQFVLLDVRSKIEFDDEHIAGSINIPYNDLANRLSELAPFDREIITLCSGDTCHYSTKAATQLLQAGFTNVWNYDGGLAGWKAKNLPTVKSNSNSSTTNTSNN